MNNEKEIIDQFLKRKVEDADYTMQEAHWQHALKALQHEGDKPTGWAYWFKKAMLSLVLVGVSILGYIGYNTFNKNKPTANALASNAAKATITANEINNNDKKNIETNNTNTTTDPKETAPHQNETTNTPNTDVNNTSNATNSEVNTAVPKRIIIKQRVNNKKELKEVNKATPVTNIVTESNNALKLNEDNAVKENKNADAIPAITSSVTTANETAAPINNTQELSRKEERVAKRLAIAEHKAQLKAQRAAAKQLQLQQNANAKLNKETNNNKTNATINADNNASNNAAESALNKNEKLKLKTKKANKTKANNSFTQIEAPATVQSNNINAAKVDAPSNTLNKATTNSNNKEAAKAVPYNKSNPRFVEEEDRVVRNVIRPRDTIGNEASTTASSANNTYDASNSGQAKAADDKVKIKKERTYTKAKQGLQANVALSMVKTPLSNTTANNTFKPSASIGIGYNMPLSARFQLQAFVAATYIKALRDPYTAIKYQYGFGANHQTFNISEQSILQMQVPLCLQYQLFPKQYIGAGLGIGFNAGVLSKVKDFNTNYYVNRWGYNQFYNPFSFYGQLNYQYLVNSKLALSAQYLPGFTDLTNNAFNRNVLQDKGTRFNLGFNFNFGK